jgi:glycosyltransferase involved in cell wall biosynthesis
MIDKNITFFHRNKDSGFSINKVFQNFISALNNSRIIQYYLPSLGARPISLIKNLIFALKNRGEINHVSGDVHYIILALLGKKNVLTIHDLVFLKNSKNKIDYYYKYIFWLYLPVKCASIVTCISENTKREVLNKVNSRNIQVIYNAVGSEFICADYPEINNGFDILHIGTAWNKNLENVINALSMLSNYKFRLIIIGKLSEKQKDILIKSNILYVNKFDLSDSQIYNEYCKCHIVSFPSLYEGFGMPIIEGQSVGRPVLTSNIEPLKEIANGSVIYVNPYKIESIVLAFESLFIDENLRNNLILKGKKNAERFKPETISLQYLKLYEKLLK